MYSANYGFPNAAGQTFNGAPPSQNAHLQPGQGPNPNPQPSPQHQQHQQHQHQQHQQPMMYNPQQFPMSAQGAAASAFPGAPNMMPGVGPANAMMQNNGMPHMATANGQSKPVSCVSRCLPVHVYTRLCLRVFWPLAVSPSVPVSPRAPFCLSVSPRPCALHYACRRVTYLQGGTIARSASLRCRTQG